jgi:hypothetical protein
VRSLQLKPRRLVPLLAGATAAVALGPAIAPARAAEMTVWRADSSLDGVFGHKPLHDTVPRALAHSSRFGEGRAVEGKGVEVPIRIYTTPKGEPLRVAVSPAFPDDAQTRVAIQSYVDFLASRLHGSEISRLTSYLAPLREVRELCGALAVGCYSATSEILVVPAQDTLRGEYSKEFVVTHEYGHHIARNRTNYPWRAISYGPKHWARLHHICQRVAAGKLWPGDQGKHYFQDPGEGWAQAYALYHYPHTLWRYSVFTRPIGRTPRAIRTDVLVPWGGPGTWVVRGGLHGGSATKVFATPLDGRVVIRLAGPRTANFDLSVVGGGSSVSTTSRSGSQEVAVANVCGTSRLTVRVSALRGGGRYTLVARIP